MGYVEELIDFIGPADNLLELGCGDRNNLRAYTKKYPCAIVRGVDITETGKDYCDITRPLLFRAKTWDVVLVAGVLMTIAGEIAPIITELQRVGKKVILVDFHDPLERDFSVTNFVRKARDYSRWAKIIKPCREWPGPEYPIKGSLMLI